MLMLSTSQGQNVPDGGTLTMGVHNIISAQLVTQFSSGANTQNDVRNARACAVGCAAAWCMEMWSCPLERGGKETYVPSCILLP
jgi:hypothetical protein